MQHLRRRRPEPVVAVVGVQGAVQEQDARRQRVAEVGPLLRMARVEDAAAEATEGDPEGEAQVIGGGLGVVFGFVGRERFAFRAVYGGLCPGLGVAPWRSARPHKLHRGFPVRL